MAVGDGNQIYPYAEFAREASQALGPNGHYPAKRESKFAIGVDLGQSIDPTAICVVEKIREPGEIGTDLQQKLSAPRYEVRYLERLPLGTDYMAVISHVTALMSRPPLPGNCRLVLDRTGVGRPIADLFQRAGLRPISITITAGEVERQDDDGSGFHVAKLALVGRLQALFHSGELKIAKSLGEAKILAAELQDFRANISDAGFASFSARVGKHDDLVLALAIACWWLAGSTGTAVHASEFLL